MHLFFYYYNELINFHYKLLTEKYIILTNHILLNITKKVLQNIIVCF